MPSATVVQGSVGTVGKRRLLRLRHVLLGLALTVVAIGMVVNFLDLPSATDIAGLGILIGLAVTGGVTYFAASTYHGRERLAWRTIGVGMMVGSAGIVTILLSGEIAPPPEKYGPHDLVLLAGYITVMTGFAIMPQLGTMLGNRIRVLLDGSRLSHRHLDLGCVHPPSKRYFLGDILGTVRVSGISPPRHFDGGIG